MAHKDVCYTPKELHEFPIYTDRNLGNGVWKWVLRMWDNGGRNIKFNQAEFDNMGPLGRDSGFNAAAWEGRKSSNSLVG